MVMILGWLRADAERASFSKRCNRSLSAENAAGRILIATLRSRRASLARYTSPIPPAPSSSIISYGPTFVPEVRAIPHAIIFRRKALQGSDYSGGLRPSGQPRAPVANATVFPGAAGPRAGLFGLLSGPVSRQTRWRARKGLRRNPTHRRSFPLFPAPRLRRIRPPREGRWG